MKPNQEQIQAEIAKLKEMKPKVRRTTFFGDDNHAAIDAQIGVLRTNLDVNAIFANYDDNEHTLESAMYARDWLDGELGEPPSGPDGWGGLAEEEN